MKNLIITVQNQNSLELQSITKCRSITVYEGVIVTLPVCAQTGYIDVGENATLKAPFTDNLDAHSIDNTLFVCTYKRISKGVTMMNGHFLPFNYRAESPQVRI